MSAHAIFAASWPLLFCRNFPPRANGGRGSNSNSNCDCTETVDIHAQIGFTNELALANGWLWRWRSPAVCHFWHFCYRTPHPPCEQQKKSPEKMQKKREREAFAPVIYGFDYPRTQWANKGAGKVFALSKPSGKRLGNVSKLAIKQNAHASHSAGTFGGQGGALELLFSGRNLGIFRGSKAEHRNHRSSTRTCRKRLCVFSIVAIVYTRNNRRGCSGSLVGLKRLLVVVAHFQTK